LAEHPNIAMNDEEAEPGCLGCTGARPLDFDFAHAYQPIVDALTGDQYACEALVRGPAGEPASTVLSRVTPQNQYLFDQRCRVRAIEGAVALGLTTRLSINFLPNAVYRPEMCIRTTLAAARRTGFPIERMIFEATEGERVEDGARMQAILREYQRIGFLTAIDDFGAGWAGLNLLADFQPDLVKLDMHLVRGIDAHKPRQAIARSVARACQELGVGVIAEGVETASERDYFLSIGVRLMQGYFFARPVFGARPAVRPEALTAAT
jgi:EAL domain-containing protein (putative c-di-GMP-specific phosphodiesterase class I)